MGLRERYSSNVCSVGPTLLPASQKKAELLRSEKLRRLPLSNLGMRSSLTKALRSPATEKLAN